MLKILVLGAGAIGCFVGGRLAAAGHQVTLLGRPPLMNKIATDGLKLCHPSQPPLTVRPPVITSLAELSAAEVPEFILLTVKASGTAPAIEQLAHASLSLDQSYIVSLQNGVGNEEQLAEALGWQRVIAGTVTIPIGVPDLGVIEVSKDKGGLGLASLQENQPTARLAEALNQAGLITPIYSDYRAMKWSKLLLNIINNATAAILNWPPAKIIEQPELFEMEIEALQEGLAVMRAQGIQAVKLPGYPVDWLARLIRASWLPPDLKRAILRPFLLSGRGSKMPSLQIDLEAGRTDSEVEVLNGAIVRAGEKTGVATPVNRAMYATLSKIVAGHLNWADCENRPERLLSLVQAERKGSKKMINP